ncbi:particle associated protein [Yersinia phage fHe-Yen8-01]|nr:particle associated protein [Yersinia phage fHe-Yen8-01]
MTSKKQEFNRTLTQEFDDRIKNIKRRAEKCDISVAELCRRAGISRATPDRWFLRVPKSIRVVDMFISELNKIESAIQAEEDARKQ